MPFPLRRAVIEDLPFILELECKCFVETRRESGRAIRHGILSPHQEVWVLGPAGASLDGTMTLRLHPHSIRIYSLAVDPAKSGHGIGKRFMAHAEQRAIDLRRTRLSLEAETANPRLIDWYQRCGYTVIAKLSHYYGRGLHAVRMCKPIA